MKTMVMTRLGDGKIVAEQGVYERCEWLEKFLEARDEARGRAIEIDELYEPPLEELRAIMWDMSGGKCVHCGEFTNPFRDFRISRILAAPIGLNELVNFETCCAACYPEHAWKDAASSPLAKRRRAISPKLRFDVFTRDNFTCHYCGERPPDVVLVCDHVLPVAAGGATTMDNLVAACEACNSGKSATILPEPQS